MSAYIPVAGWLSSSSVSGSSATAGVPIWSDNLDSLSEIASSISVSVTPSCSDRLPTAAERASYSEAPCSIKASISAKMPVASDTKFPSSSYWASCPTVPARSSTSEATPAISSFSASSVVPICSRIVSVLVSYWSAKSDRTWLTASSLATPSATKASISAYRPEASETRLPSSSYSAGAPTRSERSDIWPVSSSSVVPIRSRIASVLVLLASAKSARAWSTASALLKPSSIRSSIRAFRSVPNVSTCVDRSSIVAYRPVASVSSVAGEPSRFIISSWLSPRASNSAEVDSMMPSISPGIFATSTPSASISSTSPSIYSLVAASPSSIAA